MNEQYLDKIKAAWNQSFDKKELSESEIHAFLGRQSGSVNRSFRNGLVFDMVLKSVLAISFVIYVPVFATGSGIVIISSILFLFSCYLMWQQYVMLRRIQNQQIHDNAVKTYLKNSIERYRSIFFKASYLMALTNPLLFISGQFLYSFVKYGQVRPMQAIDFIVFSLFCLVGFAIGILAYTRFFRFQLSQLEKSLIELDDHELNEVAIRLHKRKQRLMLIIFLLILVAGLVFLGLIMQSL